MKDTLLCLVVSFLFALPAACQDLPAFSYPDTETARRHWQPQFGSKPVRVETLDDGSTCLALDAEFRGHHDRACWDWIADLDLSETGRISFEVSASTAGLAQVVMVYFGTPNGWYARHVSADIPQTWTTHTLRPDAFSTEDDPDGWDKVTRFRFSVWSSGAGETTFRLRNLRALPKDPGENFLINGSFEVPGVGIPYAWGSGHWGVGHLPWAADMDLFRERWGLDTTVAHHGEASLRIHNAPDMPLLRAVSAWFTPPRAAAGLVCSAWLRSDREGLPVVLQAAGRSTTAQVGTEWTQAQVSGVAGGERTLVTIAPQAPGTLWVDAVQVQEGDEATAEFHAAFAEEAIAAREAEVDWSPPRRTDDIAAGRAISGPVAPARTEIDTHGRFLLDGEPYLQHSFGLEFVSDPEMLDLVARLGFRDVCVQIRETLTTAQVRDIFDRCAQVGLRIIPWLDGRMTREQFTEHITTLRDHPALLCWYVYDEPSGERFAEADARVALARELDPARPAYINYLPHHLENQTGDIYSTDVYPIPHSTPMAAIRAVATMKAAAARESKPVWMWLQGTGYAYWMAREPTPRELSCMVYGSLIAGARGIYYFAQVPRTRECLDEMRALAVEVDAVAPALGSLDPAPEATCDQPAVMTAAYAHEGRWWVLAVNTQGAPCEARLELPGAAGPVEVMFEDRALTAAEGAWRDAFGPYERRVYRLEAR